MASQPLLLSPTGPTLSPTGKTPLATYFEEHPSTALVSPSARAGVGAGLVGLNPGLHPGAGPEALLQEGLPGFTLNGTAGHAADDAAAGLAGLQLGVAPGLGGGNVGAAGNGQRSYSPLGGLPLFGDASLLVPSSSAGGAAAGGNGTAAGIVGV